MLWRDVLALVTGWLEQLKAIDARPCPHVV